MWPNPQENADLVTFIEEIFNGKLHFLCSVGCGQACSENENIIYFKSTKISFLQFYTQKIQATCFYNNEMLALVTPNL